MAEVRTIPRPARRRYRIGDARRAASGAAERAAGRKRRAAGFTLLELLVVLVILGLLATIATPQVLKYLGGAKTDTARLQVNGIGSALDLYRLDVGHYPATQPGLKALLERPADAQRWNGPYVKNGDSLIDPWHRPYAYRAPGDQGRPYDLYSLGADGTEGGEGENQDVRSW